jgi:hypothetical protein
MKQKHTEKQAKNEGWSSIWNSVCFQALNRREETQGFRRALVAPELPGGSLPGKIFGGKIIC